MEISLNPRWTMIDGEMRYPCQVPCSVYDTLIQAGAIPDPYVGENEWDATAVCDRENNAVTVTTDGQVGGDFDILLSAAMLDFDRPVTVTVDGETREITPAIRQEIMEETLEDRGDPSYIFEDRISTGEIKNGN